MANDIIEEIQAVEKQISENITAKEKEANDFIQKETQKLENSKKEQIAQIEIEIENKKKYLSGKIEHDREEIIKKTADYLKFLETINDNEILELLEDPVREVLP